MNCPRATYEHRVGSTNTYTTPPPFHVPSAPSAAAAASAAAATAADTAVATAAAAAVAAAAAAAAGRNVAEFNQASHHRTRFPRLPSLKVFATHGT